MHRWLSQLGLTAAWLVCGSIGVAQGDTLFDETNLVAAPGVAQGSEFSFTATTAQALTVTLTDDKAPAAFQSLQIAVTLDDGVVGMATVDGTTNVTSATVNLPAATGNYQFHVIGTPTNLGFGSFGSFSVCTAPQATPTACIAADSYSDNIQTPSAPAAGGQSTLNTNFTSTVAGTYSVLLTDDQFPVALQTQLTVAGIAQGSMPIAGPINPSTTPTPVNLAAGMQYSLLVLATADAAMQAGLYSIQITDPQGVVIFARTLPVGQLPSSTIVSNATAQPLNLTLTDLGYPTALSAVGVAVTSGAAAYGQLTASRTTTTAIVPKGNLEIWQYAVAGSQPGAYALTLAGSSVTLFSTTKVVNPGNASAATSFAFVATLPAAGTYSLAVTDFQFPGQLGSLSYTVAQNGTVIPLNSNNDFTAPAAGTVIVVADATPAQNTIGIFGVTLSTTGASPTALLDQTQAVGGVFSSRTINLGSSGKYNVTLADLEFPTIFSTLSVIVTQNGSTLGKIYAQGGKESFPIDATPGQYVVTFVATPGAQNYGLYSLNMSSAPPTVTLSAKPTSVPAGQSVQVSWTATGATSCTGSGTAAFSGSEPLSSTGIAVAIPATATLTLTCTGPGGSTTSAPVTVTATTAVSTSGGGGALDLLTLLMFAMFAAARIGCWLHRRSASPMLGSR